MRKLLSALLAWLSISAAFAQTTPPVNSSLPGCSTNQVMQYTGTGWGCVTLPAVGATAWGTITGTLALQTDLQSALDAKLATNGSAASLTSFPTLNQNTIGSAATLTTPRTINGTSFNGSANITLGAGSVTLAQMADMATASVLGRNTAGTGAPEVLATTGTGNVVRANTPTLVTPVIGAATGTSLALSGALTSTGGGIGYAAGAGGTVTQATSKATGVTLNKLTGTITLHNAALAAAAIVSFIVTNSFMAATDVVHIQHDTVGAIGGYMVMPNTSAAGSFRVSIRNNTAGSLSEAIVLRFAIIKGATT